MLASRRALGTVRVFGSFDLTGPEGESVRLPARSAAALTAYLALRPRGASRSESADALWPESDPERSRAALRTALRRVRLVMSERAVVDEAGRLRLLLDSDAAESERFRRARRHATDARSALVAARAEWTIVRQELLAGWSDEWIVPLRDDARLVANECGRSLARLLEETGEPEEALRTLDAILDGAPCDVEALEHAMRLEAALHGREPALARAAEARRSLLPVERLALPESIRRLERLIREGGAGYLPPPTTFSDGQELSLIGHLFEADLRQGGRGALSAIADNAFSPICLKHPHKTLGLLRKAIDLTEGTTPERNAVVIAAIQYAQYVNDDAVLHDLCDGLIAAFPPEHPFHNGSLTVKGGVYLQARDFLNARRFAQRAADGCTSESRRIVAQAQIAIIDGHEGRLESAISTLFHAAEFLRRSSREDRDRNQAAILGSISDFSAMRGDWRTALEAGFAVQSLQASATPAAISAAAPLGLALAIEGQTQEGAAYLRKALVQAHAEHMSRSLALALDMSAVMLSRFEERALAESVLDAANTVRRRLAFSRSFAERRLVEVEGGLDPDRIAAGPLRLQSSGTLAEWLADTIERIVASPSRENGLG